MPIHTLKRIEDRTRDIVQSLDYLLYITLNFFKFKPFPKEINKILVVELYNIGDILVITPLLKALRQKYKTAKIDVLLKDSMKHILSNNQNINNTIPYTNFKETKKKL